MITNYPYAQSYLFTALKAAPEVLGHLLQGVTEAELDFQPDPQRFTIREVIAHLADWDEIFLQRMKRTMQEDEPTIEGYDPGERAAEVGYSNTHLAEQMNLFRHHRAGLVAFLRERATEDWARACLRPEVGRMNLGELALIIPLHDTYHLQQVTEWLARARK